MSKTIVKMTETTARELMRAIEKAHREIEFTDEPWPTADVSDEEFERVRQRKGYILVKSPVMDIEYLISLETKPNTQESVGYNVEVLK